MSDDVVQVRYRGPVTVGSPGRALLHERDGGLSELVWDGLERGGWLGHVAHIHPTIELIIRVVPAVAIARATSPRFAPQAGGARRQGERGPVAEDGTVFQRYAGPLHARAAGPGVRLVASERRDEDFDFFEDMLYSAAAYAGWLPARDRARQVAAEVPDADILILIARYRDKAS